MRFNSVLLVAATLLLMSNTKCDNYCKYPISTVSEAIPGSLYGVWKVKGDSLEQRYILVQAPSDVFLTTATAVKEYGSVPNYIADINGRLEKDNLVALDPLELTLELKSNETRITEERNNVAYLSSIFIPNGGVGYQQWSTRISKVGQSYFLNIPYNYHAKGFIFCRLIEVNPDTIILAIVADETLKYLESSEQLKQRLEKNIDKKSFYKDTMHLHKVRDGHFDLGEAQKPLK